jgi:hypothetical protein
LALSVQRLQAHARFPHAQTSRFQPLDQTSHLTFLPREPIVTRACSVRTASHCSWTRSSVLRAS